MPEPYLHRVGTVLHRKWTIERFLGAGGMAAVYAAVNPAGRRVALKILHPEAAADPDLRRRFELEGRAVNQIQHPGVVEVIDVDTTEDGLPFLVMELLEGHSLQHLLDQQRCPPLDALLRLADGLLDVLVAAHAVGIVHRDLKPDNLFLLPDGRLKVLDFGIARVRDGSGDPSRRVPTQTGTILGTAAFMAPEQVMGLRDLDGRADLYAVGATLFRSLTGRHVHLAEAQFELLLKVSSEPAPPLRSVAPHLPEHLALVVDRALSWDRERRYPDAAAMQRDIRALLRSEPPPLALAPLPPSSRGVATAAHPLPPTDPPRAALESIPSIHPRLPALDTYGNSIQPAPPASAVTSAGPLVPPPPSGRGRRSRALVPLLALASLLTLLLFGGLWSLARRLISPAPASTSPTPEAPTAGSSTPLAPVPLSPASPGLTPLPASTSMPVAAPPRQAPAAMTAPAVRNGGKGNKGKDSKGKGRGKEKDD